MILVTGAAGKTGRAVIHALVARGATVRALVHGAAPVASLAPLGASEVVAGEMLSPEDMRRAVQGVRSVYHICPNMSPDELSIGKTVIAAAQRARVQRLVYHSVLHPQTEAMPHHWQKLRTEEQVLESGIEYTILQPTVYMQNLLAYWNEAVNEGIYAVPYAPETRLGMVDLEDVAEAAARVLTEPGHVGATYELCGAEVLSQIEIAQALGQVLGRPVEARVVPFEVWRSQARNAGLGEYALGALARMFRYYEKFGLWGNPRVLTGLLGRPPTRLEAFLKRVAWAARRGSEVPSRFPDRLSEPGQRARPVSNRSR